MLTIKATVTGVNKPGTAGAPFMPPAPIQIDPTTNQPVPQTDPNAGKVVVSLTVEPFNNVVQVFVDKADAPKVDDVLTFSQA